MRKNSESRWGDAALSAFQRVIRGCRGCEKTRANADRAASLRQLLPLLGLLLCAGSSATAITLDAALARTLERNPAIQEAKIALEQAAGRRLVLRSTGLPDARVIVPAGVQGGQRAGEKSVQPFAFARGAFVQPLINAAIAPSYRRGDIEVLLAKQRLNIAVLEQLHAARIAFYQGSYHDSLRALAEAQRERLETNVRAQSDRLTAGKADRQTVIAARLVEQEVRPRIEESRRISSGASLTLAQAMGDDLGPTAKLPIVEGSLQFAPFSLDAEEEATAALQRRADLKLARLLVQAAREDQRIIEAAYYPAIGATLSGDYIPVSQIRRGSEGSARRSDDIVSSEGRAGAAYTWRVIDNGKTGGAVMQQRAAREINELVLAKLEAEVPRELRRIQNNLRALQSRHDALSKAAVVAEQTVNDVQNQLAQGLSSPLEYRTAESSFIQTKTGLLAVAFEQNMAFAERDRIGGRYFQFSDDTHRKVH